MTFYEQLEKHLSVKQHVLVQNEDGEYCVFSHFTGDDGLWRESGWLDDKESAINNIGRYYGSSKAYINERAKEENWRIIKAFDIPTGRFQVGDKVVISEDAKELCEKAGIYWNIKMNDILGQVCVIKKINNIRYEVYTPNKSDSWEVPHSALSYPIETEEEEKLFGIDSTVRIICTSYSGDFVDCAAKVYGYHQKDGTVKITRIEEAQQEKSEEENTAAQEAIELLEKNGYVISKK